MTPVRAAYAGVLIGDMDYDASEADDAIRAGKLDAVAFGAKFVANHDLPARFRVGSELNVPDPATFYTPGSTGYTDCPTMNR